MKYKILEFTINNYRSISNMKVEPSDNNFLTICGSNNVGKTNFLRALNLFFNPILNNFDPECDIPYHIVEGTRGQGYKTTLKGKIKDLATNKIYTISQVFTEIKNVKTITITGDLDKNKLSEKDIINFLEKNFKFFFIEASNVNIPKLVSEIVNDEILPLGLGTRTNKSQKDSLNALSEFIDKSRIAVAQIENQLTDIFRKLLEDVESLDSDTWKLKIKFPEYLNLREAISSMIDFTLYDTNERRLDAKGSGVQRTVLLSLIQYVNSRTKKDIIWAIDEPEAFLQAGLQKNLYRKLIEESKNNQVIITTHSHFFININELDNTYLFEGTKELKEYQRKKGELFYKLNTEIFRGSPFEILQKIKENFGISKNDSWEIMPYNILVEGQEDKDILTNLMKKFDISVPNILVAGGVTKYSGFIQFISEYCSELEYKPTVVAIFDKDQAGRQEFNKLKNKKYKYLDLECEYIIRYDNERNDGIQLEDFVYPELLFNSTNKFLRKNKYVCIRKTDKEKRRLTAYNSKPILEFITEISRSNNEDKKAFDFNDMSIKLFLSKTICEEINKNNLSEYDKEYPDVKKFLIKISDIKELNKSPEGLFD